jgi:hypothetical protein
VTPQSRSYYTTNNPYGYTFGYANLTDGGSNSGNSTLPYTTAIVHGDYDYVTGTFRWDSKIADRDVPASYYLSGKPAWFGSSAWPAFGPDLNNSALAVVTSIPAKTCYDQGKMPGCLSTGGGKVVQPPTNLQVK